MQEDIILKLSEQLNIKTEQIQNTLKLLEEAVPFLLLPVIVKINTWLR